MPETNEQVAKHTPGPWMIAYWPIPAPNWWIGSPPTHPGSSRLGPSICGMIHVEANAHLIAAAPNLKDGCNALLGLLQLLAARDDVSDDLRKALTSGHRIDEARAAVAKSEGN
jgi:hypothetical protein